MIQITQHKGAEQILLDMAACYDILKEIPTLGQVRWALYRREGETKRKANPPNTWRREVPAKQGSWSSWRKRCWRWRCCWKSSSPHRYYCFAQVYLLSNNTPKLNQNKQTGRAGSQLQNVVSGWLGGELHQDHGSEGTQEERTSRVARELASIRDPNESRKEGSQASQRLMCVISQNKIKSNQIKSNHDRILWWENPQEESEPIFCSFF